VVRRLEQVPPVMCDPNGCPRQQGDHDRHLSITCSSVINRGMSDPGEVIGPWTLVEKVDEGGNGEVWRARGGGGEIVALKLLKARRVQSESYQRFVREIRFLRDNREEPGVLPLVDAYLPEQPTKADRPWLAMPVAQPIGAALAFKTLDEVVLAVKAVSETLAALQADHDVAHRDIKPSNLYELDGRWLIGDFGLISFPDADTLTGDGRQIGPANFTAYEMIDHPTTADPHPADVYSLGKTLWVLATGQNWPPLGHQPATSTALSIGEFRPHRNAARLDELIDRMSRHRPAERPTKAEVATELATWLTLATEPVAFDLSDRRDKIRAKLRSVITEQETEKRLREAEQRAIRRLQELTKPLNDGLKHAFPRVEVDVMNDEATTNIVKSHRDCMTPLLHRWQRCTRVIAGDGPVDLALSMSRSLELLANGELAFTWMIDASPQKVMGGRVYGHGPVVDIAMAESVEVDAMLERQVSAMTAALEQAVDALITALPDS
jgi:serine/threonine protein kinase